MKTNILTKTLILAIVFLLFIAMIPNVLSAPNKSGYNNVKSHVITGSTDGSLTDYQMLFVVHKGIGIDNGQDVYLNDGCLSWPNDIRFANNAGTQLSYWVEKYDTNTAQIWVKIDSIPIYPNTATVKICYGKADDLGASNGFTTFVLFEDFSDDTRRTSVWTETTLIDSWFSGFPDVHVFENGGYHIKQNSPSGRQAWLRSTNSLGRATICNVTLEVISESGSRTPTWTGINFGYGLRDTVLTFGYWGGSNGYDPLPGHTYLIQWSDGSTINNFKLYENDVKLYEYSFNFDYANTGLTYKPIFGISTAHDAMGEWCYKNFYARAYTANPPTHGKLVNPPNDTQKLWDAVANLQTQIDNIVTQIAGIQSQITSLVSTTDNLQSQINDNEVLSGTATFNVTVNEVKVPIPEGFTIDQCKLLASGEFEVFDYWQDRQVGSSPREFGYVKYTITPVSDGFVIHPKIVSSVATYDSSGNIVSTKVEHDLFEQGLSAGLQYEGISDFDVNWIMVCDK